MEIEAYGSRRGRQAPPGSRSSFSSLHRAWKNVLAPFGSLTIFLQPYVTYRMFSRLGIDPKVKLIKPFRITGYTMLVEQHKTECCVE